MLIYLFNFDIIKVILHIGAFQTKVLLKMCCTCTIHLVSSNKVYFNDIV